jgi:hypothetical protein
MDGRIEPASWATSRNSQGKRRLIFVGKPSIDEVVLPAAHVIRFQVVVQDAGEVFEIPVPLRRPIESRRHLEHGNDGHRRDIEGRVVVQGHGRAIGKREIESNEAHDVTRLREDELALGKIIHGSRQQVQHNTLRARTPLFELVVPHPAECPHLSGKLDPLGDDRQVEVVRAGCSRRWSVRG